MTVSSRPRKAASPRRWVRFVLWSIPVLFVLLIAGFFAVKAAIDSYLHSDGFRQFVSKKAGGTMHADAELAPLDFKGMSIYTDGFKAQGGPEAAFSELALEQVRAEISLRKFFEKTWVVDQVDVALLRVDLQGPRANRPVEPAPSPLTAPKTESQPENTSGWLPNRVEVSKTVIRDLRVTWADGGLKGTTLELHPYEGGWQVAGKGGRLEYAKLPPLDLSNLQLRYRAPSLFINPGTELRQPGGGSVQATGEVNFSREMDLRLTLANVDMGPYLSDDWRMKAKGNISGEVTVRSPIPSTAGPQLKGSLRISNGELTALPVLDQITKYTKMDQFRRLNLTNASGDFEQQGEKLRVSKLVVESEGLIRMEGDFTVVGGIVDGTFRVGVTPGSLQWLPGAQAKVFTESRGGYLWAPMRLAGPVNKLSDDLTPRLAAAAQGAVIEGVQNAAGEAVKTGKEAVKSIFDLVLPPNK